MAHDFLPKMIEPHILDVGCGSGVPTLELAKMSNGTIIAIDVDMEALTKFHKKLKNSNYEHRITIKQISLLDNEFPDENFDIIWAEGAIHVIGFKKGMNACHRILKKKGFLVLLEAFAGIEKNLELFSYRGFKLVKKIVLPEGIWLKEYFDPLEKLIETIDYSELGPDQVKEIEKAKDEIEWVKNADPEELDCAFYIFLKN